MDIRTTLKQELKSAWFAKETHNRDKLAYHKEIIRKLWPHRHSNKPVSAIR